MSQESEQLAKGPHKKGVHRIKKRDEESPEGGEHRESGAGARVGMAANWTKHKECQQCETRREPTAFSQDFAAKCHISIPRTVLKRRPAANDKRKKSHIQFHSTPANAISRAGYCT